MHDGRAPRIPSAEDAVAATVACAEQLGLSFETAEVVAAGYSVRVRLLPLPVLSRVITEGQVMRGDPAPWLARELDVVDHLASRGAAVAPPWDRPGPFVAHGLPLSLWRWIDHDRAPVSSHEFGGMLRELHEQLDSFDRPLPALAGPLTDIRSALVSSNDPTLHAAARILIPRALSWPRRVLHGDAHMGNVLRTDRGAIWIDFEDVCVGPLEWDLSSRTLSDDAIAGYGGEVNPETLSDCRDLRRLQILASIVSADPDDTSDLRVDVTAELDRIR